MSKPKPVNWELIKVNRDSPHECLYEFVVQIINQYHDRLNNLIVVLMWRYNVRPDPDGYMLLADITKSSDKMRELFEHDVVIGINKQAWQLLSDKQKRLLIDTQLERVVVCLDKDGKPKEDDRSRLIYRLKRMEVIDERIMLDRHNTTMDKVHEYVYNKMNGQFETGSYADKIFGGEGTPPS